MVAAKSRSMNLASHWRKLTEALLDLLFPPRCVGCGREGEWFCQTCQSQLAFILPPVCPMCGLHLPVGSFCSQSHSPWLDAIRSVAYSEGALREAIHQFKYRGVRALALPFGKLLYGCWQIHEIPADVIVPVPLHPRRLRERGYNQSELLAEQLGRHTGVPVNCAVLRRVKHTLPQVGLNAQRRRENVADAFQAVSDSLADQRVVLIDDVCTTGATLEACSVALKTQGARSVWALTLGRAKG